MSKAFLKILAAASALSLVAACTNGGEPGKPNPVTSDGPTSGTSSAAKELPKRPAELKLDGVDACKLLTPAQMSEIKILEGQSYEFNSPSLGKQPGCSYTKGTKYAYSIILVKDKGVPFWLTGSGNVDVKVVTVAGYGAAQLTLTGAEGVDCSVTVDVADGQQLEVGYDPVTEKGVSQDQMCANAAKAAEFAVATLKTLK
ncbi:DUF3558 domain-containing protein [Lentzea sp. NPDC058436]|uniref:DUF3558 domain-containing protein n=1 Tax=Lentzea sp. NPDC058436 TaxID=3346499 RepID=UPI00364606D3